MRQNVRARTVSSCGSVARKPVAIEIRVPDSLQIDEEADRKPALVVAEELAHGRASVGEAGRDPIGVTVRAGEEPSLDGGIDPPRAFLPGGDVGRSVPCEPAPPESRA